MCVVMTVPFAWMVLSSVKTSSEILRIPITWLPANPQWDNFIRIFDLVDLGRGFLNSTVYTVSSALLVVFTSSLGGYAFAKFEFKGKELIFTMLMATLMIPFFITLIPSFLIIVRLGWRNSLLALIIPSSVSAYGMFLMRQYIVTIPDDLLDAARLDGCSEFSIFMSIILPLSKPAAAVLGLWSAMGSWNAFLWPLIVIDKESAFTLPLTLLRLQRGYGNPRNMNLAMAGVTLSTLPILVFAIVLQKYLIKGVSGVAGLKA